MHLPAPIVGNAVPLDSIALYPLTHTRTHTHTHSLPGFPPLSSPLPLPRVASSSIAHTAKQLSSRDACGVTLDSIALLFLPRSRSPSLSLHLFPDPSLSLPRSSIAQAANHTAPSHVYADHHPGHRAASAAAAQFLPSPRLPSRLSLQASHGPSRVLATMSAPTKDAGASASAAAEGGAAEAAADGPRPLTVRSNWLGACFVFTCLELALTRPKPHLCRSGSTP